MKHSEVDYGLSLTNCVIIKQDVAKFSFYSKLTLQLGILTHIYGHILKKKWMNNPRYSPKD